jgi:hypothetical protein
MMINLHRTNNERQNLPSFGTISIKNLINITSDMSLHGKSEEKIIINI